MLFLPVVANISFVSDLAPMLNEDGTGAAPDIQVMIVPAGIMLERDLTVTLTTDNTIDPLTGTVGSIKHELYYYCLVTFYGCA